MIICPLLFVCVCVHRKTLQVRIINMQEYEKQENFYIVLEEPKWLKRGISGLCVLLCFLIIPESVTVLDFFSVREISMNACVYFHLLRQLRSQ